MMIAELGHYALILALAVAIVQSIIPLIGARIQDNGMMAVAAPSAVAQMLLIALSFCALTYAYVTSDFSVSNVYMNSHTDKPMIYKITGVWGNHEGSMLLWILILAVFGAAVAVFGRYLPNTLQANVLAVQAMIAVAFLAFIVITSNPFTRLDPAPYQGRDLNPLLQDIGLAIHPPLLYLGYVGLSIAFSFAVAALIEGRIDSAWARWVRPWTLAAWLFLTAGISMGSYWAYYELGWGGWWFWDPVENASFMPWLAATALLHSAIVMEKREALKVWTILLAILAFSLSLLGTFLVRSGVLTSVHAFAVDPERGVFILGILVAFIGGSFALFAWRAPMLRQGGLFAPMSREGALVFNNLFLMASTGTVFVGTLYPLFVEALTDNKISVGEPFFNLTFGPLMIPLLLAVPFGPFLAWKRADLGAAAQRLAWVMGLSVLAVAVSMTVYGLSAWAAALGLGLGAWLILGAIFEPLERAKFLKVPFNVFWSRLKGLPRSVFGTTLAHSGLGVTVLGIVFVSAFEEEIIRVMKPGDTQIVGGLEVVYKGTQETRGPNFTATVSTFDVIVDGEVDHQLTPSKRVYNASRMPTTEAAIETFIFSQVYISVGDPAEGGGRVVRLYDKPMVTLIWHGTILMTLGGLISLSDRRLRIGVPTASRRRRKSGASEEPANA